MAYINQEEEQNQVSGMNVLGNTPGNANNGASQPPQSAPMSTPSTAPLQPSTGQNTAQAGGATPSPTSSPSASAPQRSTQPKASSGMFTNIRKYINANKPQATAMSQAAGQTFGKTAQNLEEQVGKKTDLYGTQVQQQQNLLQQERDVASDLASNIANNQSDSNLYTDDQYNRVRNVITGQKQFDDVQNLNLAKEQNQISELQRQAQAANTEEGRTGLLKQTFGAGPRDYNRGQQGLDSMIIQGSDPARQNLINTLDAQAQATTGSFDDLKKQALQNVAQYRQDRSNLGQDVSGIIESQGAEAVSQQIDQAVQQELAQRQELANQLGVSAQQLDDYLKQTGQNFDPNKTVRDWQLKYIRDGYHEGILGSKVDTSGIDDLAFDAAAFDRNALMRDTWINSERQRMSAHEPALNAAAAQKGQEFQDLLTGERDSSQIDQLLGNVYNAYSNDLSDQFVNPAARTRGQLSTATYGRGGVAGFTGGDYKSGELTGGENALAELSALREGQDVSRQTAATSQDVARYNALQDLLKGKNIGEREFVQGSQTAGQAQEKTEGLRSFYNNLMERLNKASGN